MATPGLGDPFTALGHAYRSPVNHLKDLPLTKEEVAAVTVRVLKIVNAHTSPAEMARDFFEGAKETPSDEIFAAATKLFECLRNGWYIAPEKLPRGVYDHFKGGVYRLERFSSWASGRGEQVCGYLSMLFGTDHTRYAWEWCDIVEWPDGKYRPRFVYRGPDLRTAEPAFKVPSPTVAPGST